MQSLAPGTGISRLQQLEQSNPRYGWLRQYLDADSRLLHNCLYPVVQGRTRAVVADISTDAEEAVLVSSLTEGGNQDAFRAALTEQERKTDVRLIFVTSISGVGENARKEQLSNAPETDLSALPEGANAPIITRARTAGRLGTHPIPNHQSFLPDPQVLRLVLEASDLDPAVVLRHLDQSEHLNSPARSLHLDQLASSGGWINPMPTALRVAVDQANHVTAVLIPGGKSDPSRHPGRNATWTVVMLATEDDCFGIDFNRNAPSISQVMRSSTETIAAAFESSLRSLTKDQLPEILANPSSLVWLYMGPFMEAAACHISLLRRQWSVLYEPHANTSAAYGGAMHRDIIRNRAREYGNHLRYINTSLENLKRALPPTPGFNNANHTNCPWWCPNSVSNLGILIVDLECLTQDLSTLKAACDHFLEQQVSNISLQEARMSMREAKDLKRLSYLGFVFAPLSLASSFFSVQIEPLSDPAPLWVFIVTALAILAFSTAVLFSANSKKARKLWKGIKGAVLGLVLRASEPPPDDKTYGQGNEGGKPPIYAISEGTAQDKTRSSSATVAEVPQTGSRSTDAQQDPVGSAPRVRTTGLETAEATDKVAGGSPRSQSSSAAKKKQRKKVPMNDRTLRVAERKLQNLPTAAPNPFYMAEYKDMDSSFDTPLSGTGVSPSLFSSPAQHRPTGRRPKPSTSSSGGLTSASPALSAATGSSSAEKQVSKVTPFMSPLPEEHTEDEKLVEEATVGPSRDISTSSYAIQRGIEQATEPSPENPVQDAADSKPANKVASLHEAARTGDVGAVQRLLDAEACHIEDKDARGKTSIQWAAEEGHKSVVRLLLERRASAYRSNTDKFNTLALAANNLHKSVVRLLVNWPFSEDVKEDLIGEALADVYKKGPLSPAFRLLMQSVKKMRPRRDEVYNFLLWPATSNQDQATIAVILKAVKNREAKKKVIERGLDCAVDMSLPEMARLFLNAGAYANWESGYPLWLASGKDSEEIVRMLLDRGADPNLSSSTLRDPRDDRRSPLASATKHGNLSVIRLLLEAGANPNGRDVVRNAAYSGSVPAMRLLVDAGADVNVENTCGYSSSMGGSGEPLGIAAEKGHSDMVRFLLQAGINLETTFTHSAPKKKGEIALIEACECGQEVVALMLMDAGVTQLSYVTWDDYLYTSSLYTSGLYDLSRAVMDAARNGLTAVLERFLKAASNDSDWPAGVKGALLNMAAEYGREEAVSVLLQHGAEVTARSPIDEETALHAAAREGQSATIQLLLDHGAEIDARNKKGETSLHVAAREGNIHAVEGLLGRGARINSTDNDSWTAAHRAAWNKHEHVLELLTARNADLGIETSEGFTIEDLLEATETDNENRRGTLYRF